MKASVISNELNKTGQLLLCPNCNFRITIINHFGSQENNSNHSSQLAINSVCYDNNHKKFSNDYIHNLKNANTFCVNHSVIGKFLCERCNCVLCEDCASEHEKQKLGHLISLYVEKSTKHCNKHLNETANCFCKQCEVLFCDKCSEEHKEHECDNNVINDKSNIKENNKKVLLEIKKQQAKQIENLVIQLVQSKEEVQLEIHEIENQLGKK